MIAKVSRGSSGRGLIRYLFGPGRANEHTDQRVITAGLALGGEVLAGRGLSTQEIADLGADLDEAKEAFAVDTKAGHLYHLSLSLPATDRQVTDDQWTEIAQKAMEALGFEREGLVPAAWVAIGHGVSTNGNQHIHLAASMIRTDGSLVDIWQDRKTLSRVCAEVEGAFELTVVRGRAEGGMPGLTRTELDRTERERRAVPARFTLARRVREASVAAKDEAEFVRRLRAQGVLVRPRFETGGQDAVVGYSIALRTTGGDTPIFYGGGKLAKDLTLPSLRQFWEQSPSDRNEAVAEWRATESVTPGRESVLGAADNWQQAAAGAERIVETLRALPVSDLAAWRGAAREAAGVFAGWSRQFEGDSSGPMGSAADALARSAQSGPGDPVANRRAAGGGFSRIAAVVAQGELSNDSPLVWAMLVDQLGRTLGAISDVHLARGEAELAKAIVAGIEAGIGELHDHVPGRPETSSEREVESDQEITRRPLYVSGPGVGPSVLDLDDDDPNFELDEFDRNQSGIDFER
jgi:hypothetical protein